MSPRSHRHFMLLALALSFLTLPIASFAQQYSDLWGANGERWNAYSRLPDFSFAGYHHGEQSPPVLPQTATVSDFGAKGDGIADDTQAFKDAINATQSGAIFIPAGRYKITDFIYIKKSGIVLRGAGPDKTVLWFPKSLNEIAPRPTRNSSGEMTTAYSFNFAFLTLQGDLGSNVLTNITQDAKRGDQWVSVASTDNLKIGQTITIRVQEDAEQSLKTALYAQDPGDIKKGKKLDTRMVVTITGIKDKVIHFNRPLRFPTQQSWQPEILAFTPTVMESGIENIGLEFPELPYPGHFKESGFNGVELRGVTNCWVKNIRLHNADSGVLFIDNSTFNTVDGVLITAYPKRGGLDGHHAFQAKRSYDNLITGFSFKVKFVHDISVENAAGNVFANGKGMDMCFDHHKDTPYANLYSDIDCGWCSRVWASGGGKGIGRHSAAWATLWNIRGANQFDVPPADYAPAMINLVAVGGKSGSIKEPEGKWIESIPSSDIFPKEIRSAQLAKRLSSAKTQDASVSAKSGAIVKP